MSATAAAVLMGASLALPPGAAAQVTGDVDVSLAPATAGKASRLSVTASGQGTSSGQQTPNSISVRVARGFRFDPRAVAEQCSDAQRNALSCPPGSRIGTGSAQGRASFLGQAFDFRATIEVFLMAALERGDEAGIAVVAREQATGRQGSGKGRVIPLGGDDARFGLELRFDELPTRQIPLGASVQLDRLELSVAANRTVRRKRTVRRRVKTRRGKRIRRKRVVRKRRYDLLRNPASCAGGWPYQARVTFPSAPESVYEKSVPCSPP